MNRLLAAALVVYAWSVSGAPDIANLLENGSFEQGLKGWSVPGPPGAVKSVIDVALPGVTKAVRLQLKPDPGAAPWAITMMHPVNAVMDNGDRVLQKLWLRSPDEAKLTALLEITTEPYTKDVHQIIEPGPQWREYEIAGQCAADYNPGDTRVGFHLAFGAGTVEIANVRLLDPDRQETEPGGRPTVDSPISLIKNGDFTSSLEDTWGHGDGTLLRTEAIDVQLPGYARGVRLHSSPPQDAEPWSVGFGQPCEGFVRKGDAVYFRAWLRSPDRCTVGFVYEQSEPPHTKVIYQSVRLTPQWQEYRFVGRPNRGFRPGQSQAKFFLGSSAGVVELTGIRVENFGAAPDHDFDQTIDYWQGREHPDTWQEPALARIEKLRKGDLSIRVLSPEGKPVPDAQVHVKQQRHHFRFGTALPAGRLVDTTNPDNVRFQQQVQRLFNTVTFENDLKWTSMSPSRLETVDRAIQWLADRDIDVRGHCLLWGSYRHVHPSVRALRGQELLGACRAHVTDYTQRMAGKLYLWDVVNEAGSNTELWEEIGRQAFADAFRWARQTDSDTLLCYNDYGILNENPGYRRKVSERIKYLLDQGAPVDRLGLQAHMHLPLTPIHRVLELLDEWAAFGRPLEITEFDIGCADDEAHAAYVRDFMTAAFSHPDVQAFIMWGFWEGSHWRAKDSAAMFRRDWTKRPAQKAYEDLVFNRWWTDATIRTADDGRATVRAFYGRHEVGVRIGAASKTVVAEITPGGDNTLQVRLD